MDEINIHQVIANIPLFRGLEARYLDGLAKGCRFMRADKGIRLFSKGESCDGFFYLIQGRVKLAFLSSQGAEKVVELIQPGMTFAEAVMFLDAPYPLNAETLEDSHLLFVGRESVMAALGDATPFCHGMLAALSQRLHHMVRDMESFCLHTATERVIGYLLNELEAVKDTNSDLVLQLPVSKSMIASILNITPETFSRALHRLEEAEIIRVERRSIHILDLQRLRHHRAC